MRVKNWIKGMTAALTLLIILIQLMEEGVGVDPPKAVVVVEQQTCARTRILGIHEYGYVL